MAHHNLLENHPTMPSPLPVDLLFATRPELFAYELPSEPERGMLKTGDLVKLFFIVAGMKNPRPIWLTVVQADQEEDRFSAQLANMSYRDSVKSLFKQAISFSSSHIYRMPLNRPEIENSLFDPDTRGYVAE